MPLPARVVFRLLTLWRRTLATMPLARAVISTFPVQVVTVRPQPPLSRVVVIATFRERKHLTTGLTLGTLGVSVIRCSYLLLVLITVRVALTSILG